MRAPSQDRSLSRVPEHPNDHDESNGKLEKFPELDVYSNGGALPHGSNGFATTAKHSSNNQWHPRSDGRSQGNGWGIPAKPSGVNGHSRQKSLGDAIRTIRTRHGSMSQNAHEIAEALKAPVSPMLIFLCVLWYTSSALTNTSSKSILNAFDKPATLTLVQFAFVSFYCVLLAWLATIFPQLKKAMPLLKHGIRYPTPDIIKTTLPLAAFQIGGHLLSSTATSKIPVSLVHTIKGLSPLFTVFAYRAIFDIKYPTNTYLSLIPLTLGVMLACSGKGHGKDSPGQFLGIIYALLATLIFVTQNIVSKRLFNEANRVESEGLGRASKKLDKLNLLCYSSGLAFIATCPIWAWSEGIGILGDFLWDGSVDLTAGPGTFDHGRLFLEFVFNGAFHFGQNMLAFVLLSMVSPVTYSVASLLKRVFIIAVALLWFRNPITSIQAAGIALTFLGLYLYDRTKENKADRRARTMTETRDAPLLPLNTKSAMLDASQRAPVFESPASINGSAHPYTNGYAYRSGEDSKKSDDHGRGRKVSNATWMPPGTRQQDTWRFEDKAMGMT